MNLSNIIEQLEYKGMWDFSVSFFVCRLMESFLGYSNHEFLSCIFPLHPSLIRISLSFFCALLQDSFVFLLCPSRYLRLSFVPIFKIPLSFTCALLQDSSVFLLCPSSRFLSFFCVLQDSFIFLSCPSSRFLHLSFMPFFKIASFFSNNLHTVFQDSF